MRNKKFGFTLIELLAVIIILAIVALIATPIVLNVIGEAKISAGKSEAQIILGGINNYCATENIKAQMDPNYKKICTSDMDVNDVPTMVNLGNASINEISYTGEKISKLIIESNNHTFTLCPNEQFAMDDEKCSTLIEKLLEQYDEDSTTGLLKDETNPNIYYYKGTNEEVSNNFLWYGGHQWRVIEFDTSDNSITLISQQPLTAIQPSSTVWTNEEEYNSSYINTWLNEYFWNSLDSSIQNNILDNAFNIGVYGETDEEQNVSEITTVKRIGLLDVEQYLKTGDGMSTANSFLNIEDYFWLGNRYNSSYICRVDAEGNLSKQSTEHSSGVRVVIKISDIVITKGSGTLTNSYYSSNIIKNINNVQVGEYINVPYSGNDNSCGSDNLCTFRVLSKDNDSIKVVLNGLLSNVSEYGSSSTISKNHTIYNAFN